MPVYLGAKKQTLYLGAGDEKGMSNVRLYLGDKPEYRRCGLTYARLRFTTESPAECVRVLADYRSGGGEPPQWYTRGLFYRGVE